MGIWETDDAGYFFRSPGTGMGDFVSEATRSSFFSLTGSKYYHIHCIIYIIYIYYVYVGVYIYKYMNMNMYTFVNMHIYMDNHGIITMYYNIYISMI